MALFKLRNQNNVLVEILDLGGIIRTIKVPNYEGRPIDIVLGYDLAEEYLKHPDDYFGATIGRVAGRITNAQFTMDGNVYKLKKNHGEFHIHGGKKGFDKRIWKAKAYEQDGEKGVRLDYHSTDGEEGYPGNLDIQIDYLLTADNTLRITYSATTDKKTPIALTNHSYFNLNGHGRGDIGNHFLKIESTEITVVDDNLGHLGRKTSVFGTAEDFTSRSLIKNKLAALHRNHGSFYVNNNMGRLKKIAKLHSPMQNIGMEVWTTEPYTQVYTGEHLNVPIAKEGKKYGRFSGICFECQRYPDAPNHPHFDSNFLHPGERFTHCTEYRFSSPSL